MPDPSPAQQPGAAPSPSARAPLPPPGRQSLPPEQVQALEKKLKTDPEDAAARRQLLEHYSREQFRSPEARRARQQHVLWVIEHRPDFDLRGPELSLNQHLDGEAYETGRKLWQKHVEAQPGNVAILDRAANYSLLSDRATAESLWQKAEALEPTNPRWPERLAHLHNLGVTTRTGLDAAGRALTAMERARRLAPEGEFNYLISLAKMAFSAGEIDRARTYASQLLQQAPEHAGQWNHGNAIHDANCVLGRIALREGKVGEAKAFLLAAGKTPGSPQLNSFGPSMALASELVQKGEKEAVLAYLQLCRAFWRMGGERLDAWTDAVTHGRTPDFGPNLAR